MNQLKMAGLKTQDKEQKVTQMVIWLDAHCTHVAKMPSVQVVVMVSVYVFCWGPYAAQSLAAILGYAEVRKTFSDYLPFIMYPNISFQNYPLYLTVFALQFAKSSILWNPVIFVLLNKTVSIVYTIL